MLFWPEYAGRPHTNSSSGKDVDLKILFSNANKTKANEKVPIDKPLRDGMLLVIWLLVESDSFVILIIIL